MVSSGAWNSLHLTCVSSTDCVPSDVGRDAEENECDRDELGAVGNEGDVALDHQHPSAPANDEQSKTRQVAFMKAAAGTPEFVAQTCTHCRIQ